MPNIDPTTRFWIGIVITIAVGISQGALNLAHAIPIDWIPYVNAWSGIIAFVGSAILTTLNGVATTTSSRIASASAASDVVHITTSADIANSQAFLTDPKVTSAPLKATKP